jgi:CBS domain-containing protein
LIQTSLKKHSATHFASEINLAIIKRSVEFNGFDLGSPPARFAWLSIGSQGRKDQLLLTDQTASTFEDVAAENEVKDYFLRLEKNKPLH